MIKYKIYFGGDTLNESRIKEIIEEVMQFKMPRYEELPRMNLYLEQVIEEVVFILEPIFGGKEEKWITRTMVGNYVKQGLLPRPVGKKYSKEHIAYLVYISIAKQVLSMDEISKLLQIQKTAYPIDLAYNYLCNEFENILQDIFKREEICPPSYQTSDVEANVFRSTVMAVGYAIYTRKMIEIYE